MQAENFTGISSPYEAPEQADLCVNTLALTAEQSAGLVIAHLIERGLIA